MDEVGILMVAPLNKYIDDGMNLVESNLKLARYLERRLYVSWTKQVKNLWPSPFLVTVHGEWPLSPFSLPS